jgi:hypothetical protein
MPQPMDDRQQQEWQGRRRTRSIAIALALLALAVIFYVATIVWLGGNVAMRRL